MLVRCDDDPGGSDVLVDSGLILYFGAGLLWLTVVLTVVAALSGIAAIFGLGHAPPMGPVGMALFLVGIAWAEFWPRPSEVPPPPVGT